MGIRVPTYWWAVTNGVQLTRAGQQLLHVTHTSDITTLAGAEATGDDLTLKANTTDTYPYFRLYGNISVDFQGGSAHSDWFWNGSLGLRLYYSSNVMYIKGGTTAGNDIRLQANHTDTGDYINVAGGGDIDLRSASGVVSFGTYAAITTETNAGFITIKDSAGNSRKLCVVA